VVERIYKRGALSAWDERVKDKRNGVSVRIKYEL